MLKIFMAFSFAVLLFLPAGVAYAGAGGPTAEVREVVTLLEGLRKVTSENYSVRIARQDEAIAGEDALIARSGLLPRINASGSRTALSEQPIMRTYSGDAPPAEVPTADRNYFSYNINIQQLLFDFNGTLSKYRASKSLLEAQRLDTQRVRNSLALEFAIAYFDVLEAKKLVGAAEKEVERLESHLKDAEGMYSAGVITKNDLLQARVRLSDAKQRRLTAVNSQDVLTSRLSNLLLIPLDRKLDVVEYAEEVVNPAVFNYEQIWKKALEKRPEIRIADRTIEAVDFEAVAKKSEFLPKVYAKVGNDYMENSYAIHPDNWSFMVGVDINLFEGGSSRADLRKTAYRKQKLVEQRSKLVDEVKLEVKRYFLDLQNAYERIQVTYDVLDQAQENLRINRGRYEAGVGTATDVLDAVTLLTVAETNHIRSLYDYMKSEAAVAYASGEDLVLVYSR